MAGTSPDGQPVRNGAWATAELMLAVAAAAWAVLLFIFPAPRGLPTTEFPREIVWAGISFAAACFLFVAFILFTRGHPDAGIVAIFGIIMFAATNGLLAYNRYNYSTTCRDALGNPYPDACTPFRGEHVGALVGVAAALTVLQVALLVVVSIERRRARRVAEAAHRAAAEEAWNSKPA